MKKRHRYGTVLVDFLSHAIIDLLDSSKSEEVSEWLRGYPNIVLVSRDGSHAYKNAVESAHPHATQVSDRFHLIQNLTDYIKNHLLKQLPARVPIKGLAHKKPMPASLSKVEGNRQLTFSEKEKRAEALRQEGWHKTAICRELNMDPRTYEKLCQKITASNFLTKTERQHSERAQRKEKVIAETFRLKDLGYTISAIARRLDKSPITIKRYFVRDVIAISKAYGSKRNGSILSPYYDEIVHAFETGMMASKIEQLIREKGYKGSSSLIRHYVSSIKVLRQQSNEEKEPRYTIERKHIIHLLYHAKKECTQISEEECALLFEQYPFVEEFYRVIQQFKEALKEHDLAGFSKWLLWVEQSPYEDLHQFAAGIKKDFEAVTMTVWLDYSNGLLEGSINKIKVIKRIMYGSCSFRLLRNKVLLLERFHSLN